MRMLTIVLYKDHREEWRWKMVADNNKILANSGEGYSTKAGAKRAIKRIRTAKFLIEERAE